MQTNLHEIETNPKVLDSWAMLAWIRDEPPAARVRELLQQADDGKFHLLMSWINAGEVYYMLIRKHGQTPANEFRRRLPSLPLELVLPDVADILAAAEPAKSQYFQTCQANATCLPTLPASVPPGHRIKRDASCICPSPATVTA